MKASSLGVSVYLPSDRVDPDAHRRRAAALVDTFANLPGFFVRHWGATHTPEPQRLIELVLEIPEAIDFTGQPPTFITSLRQHLTKAKLDKPSLDASTALLSRFADLQQSGDIGSFELHLAAGTRIRSDAGASITIRSIGRTPVTVSHEGTA